MKNEKITTALSIALITIVTVVLLFTVYTVWQDNKRLDVVINFLNSTVQQQNANTAATAK